MHTHLTEARIGPEARTHLDTRAQYGRVRRAPARIASISTRNRRPIFVWTVNP